MIEQLNTFFSKVVTLMEVFLSRKKFVAGHRLKMLWITFRFDKKCYISRFFFYVRRKTLLILSACDVTLNRNVILCTMYVRSNKKVVSLFLLLPPRK